MAALAHALNQPIALEIAGTARSRRFIARATDSVILGHLVQQLQARYPQAVIRPLSAENDPLRVEPGEKITALELRPGAAPYLPLRTPGVRESAQEGADPLLGLVAAFNSVSGEQRVIAQLALVPAPATWSTVHQRLAVEHPLEPEREQERWTMAQARMSGMFGHSDGQSLSLPAVLGLLILVGLAFLIWRNANRFPSWLRKDTTALLHHQAVHVTAAQTMWLVAWGIGLLLALLILVLVVAWIRGKLRTWLSRTALYDQRLVQEKTMRVAYRARLRIITIGPAEHDTDRHRQVLGGFISAYRQFHLATGAYFTPQWLSARAARRLIPANVARTPSAAGQPAIHRWQPFVRLGWPLALCKRFFSSSWQRGLRRSNHLLSVADVAALWHLPQADDLDDLPFIEHTRARTLLAPHALSRPGTGFRIGASTHAGHTIPVYLPPDAARRNALAIAKTGKGKSTLLLALARAALADELGLVLIDPHGDLAEAVLALIPDIRRDDTLLVDLGDREHPIGLNLLDTTLFPDRDKAVSNLIAVFSQIWKNFWGARMESALEAALKTLYEVNEAEVAADPQDGPDRQFTLLDVTALLTFAGFRHGLLGRVRDPALLDYWVRFEALQPRFQQEIITPVTTKLDKFANSVVARRIVGQGRSTLNMAEMVRRGQVLLVKTARGVVGHDVAALIGATLLGLLHVTVGEQANLTLSARRPVRVIVDEFQTLPGVDFGAMLAELRKFGASFALATQALAYLDELDRALRPTVMANVDQLFCYAMSAEDARMVERELDGVVTISDLIALDDFHCYARLTVLGQGIPVFSLALDPPTHLDEKQREQAEALRRRSQRRIGREAQRVEMLISHAALRRKALALLSGNTLSNNSANSARQSDSEHGGISMKPLQGESQSGADTAASQQRGKTRRRRSRHAKNPAFTAMMLAENPSATTRSDTNDAEDAEDAEDAGDAGDDDGGDESADSEESESER
ncbi:MAG TPA: type IV secretory system conjugative DNA transfer family protein [Ktedonobacterales bacterium]|nr:type IV secretory system conjugative DNA transfer family protein [Ktedonobacterales bacterium]